MVPNYKNCRGQGALAIGNNFGNTFLFGDHMHGLICFGKIIRNVSNMLELLSTLDSYTTMTWEKPKQTWVPSNLNEVIENDIDGDDWPCCLPSRKKLDFCFWTCSTSGSHKFPIVHYLLKFSLESHSRVISFTSPC
jgi:hypothetical protein